MLEADNGLILPDKFSSSPDIPSRMGTGTSPNKVTQETYILIKLYSAGLNDKRIPWYLKYYTNTFLKRASMGSDFVYNNEIYMETTNQLSREAASHAFIVMGQMPKWINNNPDKYKYSPMWDFRAPETIEEYTDNLIKIKTGINSISNGKVLPRKLKIIPGVMDPALLLMSTFFETGAQMQMKVRKNGEKEDQDNREFINDILQGVLFEPEERKERDIVNRLLEGIDLNLD